MENWNEENNYIYMSFIYGKAGSKTGNTAHSPQLTDR